MLPVRLRLEPDCSLRTTLNLIPVGVLLRGLCCLSFSHSICSAASALTLSVGCTVLEDTASDAANVAIEASRERTAREAATCSFPSLLDISSLPCCSEDKDGSDMLCDNLEGGEGFVREASSSPRPLSAEIL